MVSTGGRPPERIVSRTAAEWRDLVFSTGSPRFCPERTKDYGCPAPCVLCKGRVHVERETQTEDTDRRPSRPLQKTQGAGHPAGSTGEAEFNYPFPAFFRSAVGRNASISSSLKVNSPFFKDESAFPYASGEVFGANLYTLVNSLVNVSNPDCSCARGVDETWQRSINRRSCSRIHSSSLAAVRCWFSLPTGSKLACQSTNAVVIVAKTAVTMSDHRGRSATDIIEENVVRDTSTTLARPVVQTFVPHSSRSFS